MKAETRAALRYPLTVFVVVRLGLFLIGMASIELVQPLKPVSVPGWQATPLPDPGWHNLFTVWERFDSLWFLRIAAGGYRPGDGSGVFFPLYPLLTRVVSFALGGHPFAAAMLVANASFAAALCVLYLLTAEELSVETAKTTVLLTALFPTAFFFFAPYTEPLFLLCAVSAFRAARRRRWGWAAVAGAAAALTRSVGIVLAPALAVEVFHRWRTEGRLAPTAPVAALGPVAGMAGYLAYWQAKAGDWRVPIDQQANWQRTFSWPWMTLTHAVTDAARYLGVTYGGYWTLDLLLVAPVLGAAGYAAVRFRPSYSVYLWGGLLIPLAYVFEPRPLMSMPRFVLPLFPAFWAMAELTRRWRIPRAAVAAVAAAGLGCLTLLFVNWYYIF